MTISFLKKDASLGKMRDQRFFKVVLAFTVLLWIAQVLFPTWRILPLVYGQHTVPLHYNIHLGIDSMGEWYRIYTVPAVSLLFIVVNSIAASIIWRREHMLSYLIAASTLLIEVLLSLAMLFIVLLNISYG